MLLSRAQDPPISPADRETDGRDTVPGPGRHLPALDGLRGLAVLLVIVFHVYQVEPPPAQSALRVLYGATRLGQTGVDLFFVLSGFLITGILFDTKRSKRYFLNFYGRRTLRIFPLYYGVLVIAFVVLPYIFNYRGAGPGTVWLWTYTTNLPATFGQEWGTFGHFWSLAIEEQFYLVWPLVIYAFRRETLLRICVGCVAGAVLARVVAEHLGFSSFTFTLCRMDSLTLGAFLALAARGPSGTTGWSKKAALCALLTLAAAAPLYLLQTGTGASWVQVVKYTIVAILYGSILVMAATAPAATMVSRLFHLRTLRQFGKYSYGLYVYHPMLIHFVNQHFPRGPISPAMMALKFSVILATSMAAAHLSWNLYEKHFLTLKRYFEYDDERVESALPCLSGARAV